MKNKLIFTATILTALLAACSKEEVAVEKNNEKVNFVISGPISRSVTSNDFVTDFTDGDQIGIFGTGGAEGNNNILHEVNNGTLISDEGVYYTGIGGNTANFYAYYPYNSQAAGTTLTFTVPADQSTEALFNGSDFMTATATGISIDSKETIPLNFKHRLTLVQLEVVAANSRTVPNQVTLNGCMPTLTWQYTTDETQTSGTPVDIQMWKRSADESIFWALVPAQTIASGCSLLTLAVGEQEYIFKTTAEVPLQAGSVKKFKIGIGEDGELVVFSTDITGGTWNNDEAPIEGEGTLVEPTTLLETLTFDDFTAKDIDKNKEQITDGGWWRFAALATDKVEIADDGSSTNQAMHIYREKQEGASGISWHNGAYYYAATNVVKGKYTLKFRAKSSETANMKGNQLRIGAYMQTATTGEDGKTTYTDYFAIIEKGTDEVTTVYHQVPTTDYQDYSITFNLGRVSTIHNATAAKVTDDSKSVPTKEMLQKVVLYITSNANKVDFYIDDLSWQPAE